MVEKGDSKAAGSAETGLHRKKERAHTGQEAGRPSLVNIWGIAGRQEIMEMRRLWQLRIPRK